MVDILLPFKAHNIPTDPELIRELCERGRIRPAIDKAYDFDNLPKAHHYVVGFHRKGNVVVRVSEDVEA